MANFSYVCSGGHFARIPALECIKAFERGKMLAKSKIPVTLTDKYESLAKKIDDEEVVFAKKGDVLLTIKPISEDLFFIGASIPEISIKESQRYIWEFNNAICSRSEYPQILHANGTYNTSHPEEYLDALVCALIDDPELQGVTPTKVTDKICLTHGFDIRYKILPNQIRLHIFNTNKPWEKKDRSYFKAVIIPKINNILT